MNVLPLKTSLNSPGGAWMTKFAAMRTCGKRKVKLMKKVASVV